MDISFNGLRTNIARSFNKLANYINEYDILDNLADDDQQEFLSAYNTLLTDLLALMCTYIDKEDKNFCDTIKLSRLNSDEKNE